MNTPGNALSHAHENQKWISRRTKMLTVSIATLVLQACSYNPPITESEIQMIRESRAAQSSWQATWFGNNPDYSWYDWSNSKEDFVQVEAKNPRITALELKIKNLKQRSATIKSATEQSEKNYWDCLDTETPLEDDVLQILDHKACELETLENDWSVSNISACVNWRIVDRLDQESQRITACDTERYNYLLKSWAIEKKWWFSN